MNLRLDAMGDALYLDFCTPYAEQVSEEVEEGVIARLNPTTRVVENLEILYFTKRMERGQTIKLPLVGHLRLTT
jgi:hypothetical protein